MLKFEQRREVDIWFLLQRQPAFLAAGVSMIAFFVYRYTLAPSVFARDSAELTTAAYTLGLVHAPGYPVYLILLHWFLYLPVGDIGYRANLFSAVANAGAVAFLTLLVKQLCGRWLPAVIAGLSYGFCFYAWSVSVIAEVYTFQALMLISMLWMLCRWAETGQRKYLFLATGMAGLSAANSLATLLWWPGLFVLAGSCQHWRQLTHRGSLALMGAMALGMLPLLYLPWRSAAQPAFVYVGQYDATGSFLPLDLTQPANLLWYVSGRQFGSLVLGYTPHEFLAEAGRFLHRLLAAFLGVGLPLGVWGAWVLWRRKRTVVIGLAATMLFHALFFIAYRAPDKDTMFLPVFLVWAVFIGIGLDELLRLWPRRAALAGLGLPLALFWLNLPFANVNDVGSPHDLAEVRLRSATPNAIYVAVWGEAATMQYLQLVNNVRPDVTVINTYFVKPEDWMPLVKHAFGDHRTVYSTLLEPHLVGHFRFVASGDGYQVIPRRSTP